MKKIGMRFIAIFIAAFIMLGITPISLPVAAAGLTLQQLQEKFPHGAYWNHLTRSGHNYSEWDEYGNYVGLHDVASCNNPDGYTWTPCATHSGTAGVGQYDCNSFDGGIQCWGFAEKLGYDAYGGSYPSTWSMSDSSYSLSSLKAGDIVRYVNDTHSIFVTAVNGETVTFADCNWGARCIIRWNQTTTKSELQSSFTWIRSAPYALPSSGTTLSPSVVLDPSSSRYSIGETNAVVCGVIQNPNRGTIGTIGCYLYDKSGSLIYTHQEQCNPGYVNNASVNMWTDFNADAGYTLSRSTTYQYSLYAYIDGVLYVSERATFKTLPLIPTDAVLTASASEIYLGESVTLNMSADDADHYDLTVRNGEAESTQYSNVSAAYTFTPDQPGTYTLYFTAVNSVGSSDSNQVTVTVTEPKITLSEGTLSLTVGDTHALNAVTDPAAQQVVWKSSKPQVADVTDGTVIAKSAGTADITAQFTYYDKTYTAECRVTVASPAVLTSIEVDGMPVKTEYLLGELLETDGLKLKLNYSDGSAAYTEKGFTVSGFESDTAGVKNVTVIYDGEETTFQVTVLQIGDANGDGTVNIADLIRLKRYLTSSGTEPVTEAADVERNRIFNGEDLVRLRKILLGVAYASEYTLHFDANGGEVLQDSKTVEWNTRVGGLPVPTRENCNFDGWFTAGGTQITTEHIYTEMYDITVKAHWSSDWVLASELPEDARITSEKWTYDLTTRITSDQAYVEGYTLYNTTSEWSEYGAWSGWSASPAYDSDSRKVETRTVTDRDGYTNYRYWIYRSSDHKYYGTYGWNGCYEYDEINLTYPLSLVDSGDELYGYYASGKCSHSWCNLWFFGESSWVPAVTHTEYRYQDRQLIYTYYHSKTETMESYVEITASDTVSNVQKWMRYTVD